MINNIKKCSSCGIYKKTNEFYKDNRTDGKRSKDGYHCCCKDCQQIKNKLYRDKHPDKVRCFKRNWRNKNREHVRAVSLARERRLRNNDPIGYREYKKKYDIRWRKNNPEKVAWKSIKNNAIKRGYDMEITFDEFKTMYWGQNCIYCGNKMTGLDRINNNIGYKKNNVIPSCGKCNTMKLNLSLDNFLNHITIILNNKENICQTVKKILNTKSH